MDILIILGIVSFIVLVTLIKLEFRRNRKMRIEHEYFMAVAKRNSWLYQIGLRETAECFNEFNFILNVYRDTLGM